MRSTSNKFIRHISEDIISENHHLKDEIIKTRKTLKEYQETLVFDLVKFAKQLGINQKQGFFFQTPREYLNYFVRLTTESITKNMKIQSQIKNCRSQLRKLTNQNQQKNNLLSELQAYKKQSLQNIQQLQKIKASLQSDLNTIKTSSANNQKQYKNKIINLKQELEKTKNQFNTKFLEEKKILLDKSNKEMAKLRAEVDVQLHQKQKAMKSENDKRDKQFKALFTSVSSYIEKKQGKGKQTKNNKNNNQNFKVSDFNLVSSVNLSQLRKQSVRVEIAQQPQLIMTVPNEMPMQILKQAIKPFTQYSSLLQKIADCRKQIIDLSKHNRQLSSKISNANIQSSQRQNQYKLILNKYDVLKLKHHQIYQQLINTKEELQLSKEDNHNLQKYYDERWNTEINKVKYNMEKKFELKMGSLDQQYKQLRSRVDLERMQTLQQLARAKAQNQLLKISNFSLINQNAKLSKQNQGLERNLKERNKILKQMQLMHNQELLSTKAKFYQENTYFFVEKKQFEQKLKRKDEQILCIQENNKQNMIALKKQWEKQTIKKIQQTQKQYQNNVNNKNEQIKKLLVDIDSHKNIIKTFQKQQAQRTQDIHLRFSKLKQKEVRDVKISHFEQIDKLNEKIHKLQQKNKNTKAQMGQKQAQNVTILIEKQNIINDQKYKIEESKQTIKMLQIQIKRLKQQIINQKNGTNQQKQLLLSKTTLLNSTQLTLYEKQKQIQNLKYERNSWHHQLQQCKQQFKKSFVELKKMNEQKISYYRSRIWELQQICQSGGISKREYQRIKHLTDEKNKLKQQLTLKQAENLILKQVKLYYQNKTKQLDTKLMINYEFKQQKQSVIIKKPKRNNLNQLKNIKTQISQDLQGFTGQQAVQIKKCVNSSRNRNKISQSQLHSSFYKQFRTKTRTHSRSHARVNSSLM